MKINLSTKNFRAILLFALLLVWSAFSLKAQPLQFNFKDVPLSTVLKEITQKTGYNFVYSDEIIHSSKPVTFVFEALSVEPIDNLLKKLFADIGIQYRVNGKQVALSEAVKTSTPPSSQSAQEVFGIVIDAKTREAITGAAILIPGLRSVGALSDAQGNFRLNMQGRSEITVQLMGYKTKVISVVPGRQIVVELEEDMSLLSETVVIGYGTQKKANLTGAVHSVDIAKTITSRPVSDVSRALQGSVPGLTITIPSGEVGFDPTIRIRGQLGSINGSSQPLILLDNVEIPSLLLVNPEDIESISILKDASTASIYGAKGAFGVLLITTKKGSETGRTNISYSGMFSVSNPTRKIDMATVDAMEYSVYAMEREGYQFYQMYGPWHVNRESWQRAVAWENQYGKYGKKAGLDLNMKFGRDYDGEGMRFYGLRSWDAVGLMVKQNAPTQNHQVSVNGNNNKISYNLSFAYLDQSGSLKQAKKGSDHYERFNAGLTLNAKPLDWLDLKSKFMFTKSTIYTPTASVGSSNDPWLYLYRWGPTMPLGKQNDTWLRSAIGEVALSNPREMSDDYLSAMAGAKIKLTSNWSIDADFTYSVRNTGDLQRGTFYNTINTWLYPDLATSNGQQLYVNAAGDRVPAGTPGAMAEYYFPAQTSAEHYSKYPQSSVHDLFSNTKTQRNRSTTNIFTTYDLNLMSHNLKFMLGTNLVATDYNSLYATKLDLLYADNPQFNLATVIPPGTPLGGRDTWESQAGFYGRLNYNFKEKVLLEANMRYDGTSKFPDRLKWAWFPSFSAGYRVSEERFWNPIKSVWNYMKLRASYGSIGNQTVSNTLYVPTMSSGSSGWIVNGDRLPYYGTPAAVRNEITWETVQVMDAGFDARFLKGELGVTADIFQRKTKNMIVVGAPFPNSFGADSPQGNFGELTTNGFEISLDYSRMFANGLSISVEATLADALSKITKYQETETHSLSASYYTGRTVGEIWGYTTDRLYQKEDFVWENGQLVTKVVNGKTVNVLVDDTGYQDFLQSGNFRFGPGDVKFKDLNGDGSINNGKNTIEDPGDLSVIGNSTPRYEYSFRLGLDYKGFSFSLFLQGIGSRQIRPDGPLVVPGYNALAGAMPQVIAGDFWREDRTDAYYPRPYNLQCNEGSNAAIFNTVTQTRFLLDMSYLRIKNITFGYSLPNRLISKANLSRARVYVACENMFTFHKLGDLPIDPEVSINQSAYRSGSYNAGRVGVGTPFYKTVSLGIQLGL